MATSILIATDLDRTLIYSRAAMGMDMDIAVDCVEYQAGEPLSYMPTATGRKLAELTEHTALVPVTTRSIEQYRRIILPCGPVSFAIISNGGNILVNGAIDVAWRMEIDRALRSVAALSEVTDELRARVDSSWVRKFRCADELFNYLVTIPDAVPADFLADWSAWCEPRGWSVSRQGRKIYTMPRVVSKNRALIEVRRRLIEAEQLSPDATVLAAGDGALDADMLAVADAAIRPRHGELEELNWQYRNLTVTNAKGIRAGAEIVDWFAAQAALVVV
jgi:hydroxymethylpyrimidine pyrophosphatase-like HAD family hydrolase